MMTYQEALEIAGARNATIFDSFVKARSVLDKHDRIMCSISGGKDSDIMLDLIYKTDEDHKVRYVWFDTGVEWQATRRHLDYLEEKYRIQIERIRAEKTIPVSCREYGQPFLSKNVSENIYYLQQKGFRWEDKPFDILMTEYPASTDSTMSGREHITSVSFG